MESRPRPPSRQRSPPHPRLWGPLAAAFGKDNGTPKLQGGAAAFPSLIFGSQGWGVGGRREGQPLGEVRTRSALRRGRIAVPGQPRAGPQPSTAPTDPTRSGPTRPHPRCRSAPTCPPHLSPALRYPHWARRAGRAPPRGLRGLGALLAPSSSSFPSLPGFLLPSGPRGSLPALPCPALPRGPRGAAASALFSWGVLERLCRETPAGGRGAVRTAVSTAARGGQRALRT